MYLLTIVYLCSIGFAGLSSAALCTPATAVRAEDLLAQQSDTGRTNLASADATLDIIGNIVKSKKSKRAGLNCIATEVCVFTAKFLLCVDIQTYDFRDDDGVIGNALIGDYVLVDGQEGNLYTGPFPTPSSEITIPEATVTRGATGATATAAEGTTTETEDTASEIESAIATVIESISLKIASATKTAARGAATETEKATTTALRDAATETEEATATAAVGSATETDSVTATDVDEEEATDTPTTTRAGFPAASSTPKAATSNAATQAPTSTGAVFVGGSATTVRMGSGMGMWMVVTVLIATGLATLDS